MNAIKCDKCGKFEEFPLGSPTQPDWTFLRKPKAGDCTAPIQYTAPIHEDSTWHLCPSCWKAVEQFINEAPPRVLVAESSLDLLRRQQTLSMLQAASQEAKT